MKNVFILLITFSCCLGCTNNETTVETKTSSDTITNVTNPGVGAVADDTTVTDK